MTEEVGNDVIELSVCGYSNNSELALYCIAMYSHHIVKHSRCNCHTVDLIVLPCIASKSRIPRDSEVTVSLGDLSPLLCSLFNASRSTLSERSCDAVLPSLLEYTLSRDRRPVKEELGEG